MSLIPRRMRQSATAVLAALLGAAVYLNPAGKWVPQSAAASASKLEMDLKRHFVQRASHFTIAYKGPTGSLSADVEKAIRSILDADDSLGYTVSSYRWNSSFTKTEATIKVQVSYWENAKQTEHVVARTKQIAKEIFKPGMNAHEKVKAAHDWILRNVAYDRTLVQHSAYAALTRGVTVCQGYALLTYRLLNEAGIENRIVEGKVSTGLHAWNLVKLGGQWYHLDTTFDDPVPDVKGRTAYSYYLITDAQIKKDHRWTKDYPAAVTPYSKTLAGLKASDKKKTAFYNSLEDLLGHSLLKAENTVKSLDELAAKIRSAVKAKKSSVRVRWTASAGKLDLGGLLDAVPLLSKVSTSTTAFPLGNPGDVLLEVKFK